MKKLIVLAIVLMSSSAWAEGWPGDYLSPKAEATAIAVGGGANVDSRNTNTNLNSNLNSNSVNQSQLGQVTTTVSIENPREFLMVPGVGVYIPSMIPGSVMDVTKMLYLPAGIKGMAGQDSYVETITFNGWCMDRIRLEDISGDLLKYYRQLAGKWAAPEMIRVQVWMKGQTKGWGGSGGGSGGIGAIQGAQAISGGAAGLLGYSTSYQDPQYVVIFYRLKY
jgi:hypothetical protein